MRVGIFVDDPNPNVGGGYTFEQDVIKGFLEKAKDVKNHEFFIIHRNKNFDRSIFNNLSNFKFLFLPENNFFNKISENLKKHFFTSSFFKKFKGPIEKLANKNQLDMIWFVSGYCREAIDVPYIATVFDVQHRSQPWFPEISGGGEWENRELNYRYFLSKASYVIVGTEVGREEMQLFYQIPMSRILKLPHPAPSYILDEDNKSELYVKKKYNLPNNFVFYPAQFWPHKNHINLLNAIRVIQEKYNTKINLVLTGSDKGNLNYVKKTIEDLCLSDQVYVLGFVPKNEMRALYKSSSMLAFLSLCGPENLPPLEAFSVKCPVVSSRIDGSEEQFGDAVLFCNPLDQEDIADKIYELFSNDILKKKLTDKGIKRANIWNSSNYGEHILKIINEFSNIRRNWN